MVCAGNVGQNPGGLLERPRLVASSPTMAIGHADGDGAGSGLVPSGTCLVRWPRPRSLPKTHSAAEDEGLADVVAGPDHFSAQSRSKVIWLAFHGDQDAALWNDLDQQGLIPAGLRERSLQMRAESLDQVQRLFSKAALVIAMRLHALILAATTGCPTAALSYDPKVKAAAQLANLPWLDLAHPLDVQAMTRQWTDARRDPASTSTIQQLRETADVHRTLLWEHLQMIQRHLE